MTLLLQKATICEDESYINIRFHSSTLCLMWADLEGRYLDLISTIFELSWYLSRATIDRGRWKTVRTEKLPLLSTSWAAFFMTNKVAFLTIWTTFFRTTGAECFNDNRVVVNVFARSCWVALSAHGTIVVLLHHNFGTKTDDTLVTVSRCIVACLDDGLRIDNFDSMVAFDNGWTVGHCMGFWDYAWLVVGISRVGVCTQLKIPWMTFLVSFGDILEEPKLTTSLSTIEVVIMCSYDTWEIMRIVVHILEDEFVRCMLGI